MARAPYVDDPDFTLWIGDAATVLAELPERSVDCIVTSPPYWGLRDYGEAGQLGLERTPGEYVERLVGILEEARRVLADHGTLWLNLGDSYSQDTKWGGSSSSKNELRQGYARPTERGSSGLKPKDLVGIPWRVAFALQDAGWYLRSDIIWHKPNAMPASVTDRPTTAHEYVFLLAKSRRYYFDQDAVREPYETSRPPGSAIAETDAYGGTGQNGNRGLTGHLDAVKGRLEEERHADQTALETADPHLEPAPEAGLTGGAYAPPGQPPHGNARQATLDPSLPPEAPRGADGRRQTTIRGSTPGVGSHESHAGREGAERWANTGRNVRSVWTIPTAPYPGAHFATFPRELALRCIQAGVPERVCRTCGKPSERETALDPWALNGDRPQARRAVELAREAGLTEAHLVALRAAGVTDTGKAQTTQTGYGRNTDEVARLAAEAKAALGGYHREFLLARPAATGELGDCGHDDWRPGTVLDPFMGSGTTALAARAAGRHAVGIELSEAYAELCRDRTNQLTLELGSPA